MTEERKDISTRAMASVSTGVLLCNFSEMAEAVEWLLGHPIWTHQYPALADDMKRRALEECPALPTEAAGVDASNWQQFAEAVEISIGKTVSVRKGGGLTALLPTDEIPEHLRSNAIVIGA